MAETSPHPSRSGLYFEDFAIGQTLTSAARKVSEADVMAFAALTGDYTPIHIDAEYAARHPFGRRVAHGLLGLSLASALAIQMGFVEETILAFRGMNEWKFSLPIYLEDTIRVKVVVQEMRPVRRLGGGMVTFGVEVLNQADQVVQQGTWSLLVKSRAVP